ncbi:tetraspanin-7-like [Miscanthus floridulus]|uniref:tetraspanin-7-like n=1 Tax=Miscanthus floridulus TaxID=154761 RepID=UPI003459D04F
MISTATGAAITPFGAWGVAAERRQPEIPFPCPFPASKPVTGACSFSALCVRQVAARGAGVRISPARTHDRVGVLLLVLFLTGLTGALCHASCILWLFLLILLLFAFTVFTFVVTNRSARWVVSDKGYKEYRLADYSTWLQRRVEDLQNWAKICSCL